MSDKKDQPALIVKSTRIIGHLVVPVFENSMTDGSTTYELALPDFRMKKDAKHPSIETYKALLREAGEVCLKHSKETDKIEERTEGSEEIPPADVPEKKTVH